jgi:hypothetical protein
MEIGPVSGIRLVPAIRSGEGASGIPTVPDVEWSARVGDETYTPTVARAAGGAEEDDGEELEGDPDAERAVRVVPNGQRRHISTFA